MTRESPGNHKRPSPREGPPGLRALAPPPALPPTSPSGTPLPGSRKSVRTPGRRGGGGGSASGPSPAPRTPLSRAGNLVRSRRPSEKSERAHGGRTGRRAGSVPARRPSRLWERTAERLMLAMNQHSWQGSLLALSDERNLWPCVFVTSASATYSAVDTFTALRTRRGRRGGAARPLLGLSARCGRGAALHLRETVDRRRR